MDATSTTTTRIHFGSAAEMDEVDDASIHLIITSPPYPMIEMWDATFADQDARIGALLADGCGQKAFDRMHELLDAIWEECARVLRDGGIVCINVGDATRTLDGAFQLYPNHARIMEACTRLGLRPLPGILWRKSTNKPNKFMGSGMIPPNAYVTLEHEHILVFRKGNKRRVARRRDRYESAYFWEERNRWFSDVWEHLQGVSQPLGREDEALRERSAAFPLLLPYRLIAMYSIAGDTVLDPFWGTGTTSIAAALLRRHSIGYELDDGFGAVFHDTLDGLPALSVALNRQRLERHGAFVEARSTPCTYRNATYGFEVVTKQEQHLTLYDVARVERAASSAYRFAYQPHRPE